MEVTKTIDYVSPNAREWTSDDGKTMYFVEALFDDGSAGSVVCFSKQQVEENQEALRKLIGTATDFGIKDKIREYNGQKQFSLTSFPGKPAGSGGGGGGRGGGGMSHAQAGLLAAASALGPVFAKDDIQDLAVRQAMIIELGEGLTDHLFTRRKQEEGGGEGSSPEPQSHAPASPSVPGNAITLPQMKRIKELGAANGLNTAEEIAQAVGVDKLGDLSTEDAELVIENWSA